MTLLPSATPRLESARPLLRADSAIGSLTRLAGPGSSACLLRDSTYCTPRPFATSIRHGRVYLDFFDCCDLRERARERIAANNDRLLHTMSAMALGKAA